MKIRLLLITLATTLKINGHAQIGVFDNSDINNKPCFNCSEDLRNLRPKILPEYFLLGSLGPTYLLKTDSSLDYYFPIERHKMSELKGIINIVANGIKIDTTTGFVYSRKLYDIRKRYMRYEVSADSTWADKFLIDSLFVTGEQIYSYLLGICWRYGEQLTKRTFVFSFVGENKIIFPLLRRIECDKIYFEYLSLRWYVPDVTYFYFRATPILAKYFETVNIENAPAKEIEKFEKILEDIHGH